MSKSVFAERWRARIERTASGAPTVSPMFVFEQGAGLQLVDLRAPKEATGILGHVAGSAFLDPREIPPGAATVLIDADGRSASQVALELERAGMQYVAAMTGGLAAWRGLGYGVSREIARNPEPRRVRAGEGPLSIEEVRGHLGDSRSVRWVKLAQLLSLHHVSCIDGRDERGVIGTPGGDAGEFLLSLAALEKLTGETLDEQAVADALLAHIDVFGSFYMHTDAHAVEQLLDAARATDALREALAEIQGTRQLSDFLRQPPESLREHLLELLVQPAHIGCGHIRLTLQQGDEYETRPELVESFLRAFYRLWWRGAPELIMTMLPGDHGEAAVVNVCNAEELWGLAPIPLISPSVGGTQLFVQHPDVSSFMRRLVVEFHARGHGLVALAAAQAAELEETVRTLAGKQLGATVRQLAAGLPIYDVVFQRQGEFEVRTA